MNMFKKYLAMMLVAAAAVSTVGAVQTESNASSSSDTAGNTHKLYVKKIAVDRVDLFVNQFIDALATEFFIRDAQLATYELRQEAPFGRIGFEVTIAHADLIEPIELEIQFYSSNPCEAGIYLISNCSALEPVVVDDSNKPALQRLAIEIGHNHHKSVEAALEQPICR